MKKRILSLVLAIVIVFAGFSGVLAAPDETQYDDVQRFVVRLYQSCLGRNPDPIGFADWTNRLKSRQSSGSQVAYGFVFSREYLAKNTSNDEYVTMLYYTFLDRAPDRIGFSDWVGRLNRGASRESVYNGFANSTEFDQICNRYGIVRGSSNYSGNTTGPAGSANLSSASSSANSGTSASTTTPTATVTPVSSGSGSNGASGGTSSSTGAAAAAPSSGSAAPSQTTGTSVTSSQTPSSGADDGKDGYERFAERLYTEILGRRGDRIGLADWSNRLRTHSITFATCVKGFLNSTEFLSKNVSNREYVRILYRTFLDREPDRIGWNDWVSRLNAGASRDSIVDGFANSNEFKNLVMSYTAPEFVGMNFSGWQTINGNRYYFEPSDNNNMVTGWKYIDGLRYYFNLDGVLCQNVESLIGPQSSYYVTVNVATNIVMVYAKSSANSGYDTPVKAMLCSVGVPGHSTPTGTFTLHRQNRWGVLFYNSYGQYVTRINGNILFHSVPYYTYGDLYSISVEEFAKLGSAASHGCVRLTVSDSKWIYDHCEGSTCRVFSSGEQAPFDKPAGYSAVSVSGDRGYDPRDPSLS